ncbi:proteasome assembly chaperone 3 [Rhodnius prolixus]|uniref:proteasome assembly chaperone 3 n=1 Tax=Rhodnius prolixus TaxID=13249 RepID=UPI003D18D2AB
MKINTVGCKINGVMTDIVISNFQDNLFIVITQYKKIGNIIRVRKDTDPALENQEEVYKLTYLFGKEDIPTLAAVRLLSEKIAISKNTIFALTLKEINPSVLNALVEVLNKHRTW